MEPIDVVMLTKNSEYMLEKCLASLYDNVPVRSLIVVDGFSNDKTLDILGRFNEKHGNVSIVKVAGTRAKAREVGIAAVDTDWFMFVDSDVTLSNDWFRRAASNIDENVGAVWGVNLDVIPSLKSGRFVKLQEEVALRCFDLRGGTHDILIFRKSVTDIRIPEQLHTHEDAYIINWIREKGYKVKVGDGIYCRHYKPVENWTMKNAFAQAILEFKCGLVYSRNLRYALYYPIFMFYWFMQLSFQH
jgi:glycosyltransferase involved in cell wall biosynthesis